MTSFAQKISNFRESQNIYLVQGGKDKTGRPAWFFLKVEALKLRSFLQKIKTGAINLIEYGEVIESGYGDAPNESVLQKMHDKYGFKL